MGKFNWAGAAQGALSGANQGLQIGQAIDQSRQSKYNEQKQLIAEGAQEAAMIVSDPNTPVEVKKQVFEQRIIPLGNSWRKLTGQPLITPEVGENMWNFYASANNMQGPVQQGGLQMPSNTQALATSMGGSLPPGTFTSSLQGERERQQKMQDYEQQKMIDLRYAKPEKQKTQEEIDLLKARTGYYNAKAKEGPKTTPKPEDEIDYADVQAVIDNPELLSNYPAKSKQKILQMARSMGADMSSFTTPKISDTARENLKRYDDMIGTTDTIEGILNKGIDVGKFATLWQKAKQVGGGAPEFTDYASVISNLNSILLNLRSGAAVSEQEFNRLKGFIPLENDDEEVAKVKVKRFKEETKKSMENYRNRLTQTPTQIKNETQPTPNNGRKPTPEEAAAELARRRGANNAK